MPVLITNILDGMPQELREFQADVSPKTKQSIMCSSENCKDYIYTGRQGPEIIDALAVMVLVHYLSATVQLMQHVQLYDHMCHYYY
jgi:uncharacterized protein YifN (PemK superfamily)